ncbi:MAG: hypothetical protein HY399_02025 [Elusimicrobia bacterium]|nr:hypothetical protein [Elusimicrobiota bacterium]
MIQLFLLTILGPGLLLAYPLVLFLYFPPLAFVPAAIFMWLRFRLRKGTSNPPKTIWIGAATVVWTLYGIYETKMYFWSQKVIAPIRLDLGFIAPVLYFLTITGIISYFKIKRNIRSLEKK